MGCIVSCLQNCRKQKEQDQRPLERNASEKLKSGQDDIIPIAKPSFDPRDGEEEEVDGSAAKPVSPSRSKTMDHIMEKQKAMEKQFDMKDEINNNESDALIPNQTESSNNSSSSSSSVSSAIEEHQPNIEEDRDNSDQVNSDYDELVPKSTVTSRDSRDDDYDEPVPSIKPKIARSFDNLLDRRNNENLEVESDYDNPQPYSKSVNDLSSVNRRSNPAPVSESDYDDPKPYSQLQQTKNKIDEDGEDYDELPVRSASRPVSSPGNDVYDELPVRKTAVPVEDADYDELPVRSKPTVNLDKPDSTDEVYDELPPRKQTLSDDDYDIPRGAYKS